MIRVLVGDITTLAVDAIVNAANNQLLPGGGVCGAIHRAAGPELANACSRLNGCDTGGAVITEGYNLPARYVIHAVGPVWHGGHMNEEALLASCYRESIALADQYHCTSIAFPAISCGIFGYPVDKAIPIAVNSSKQSLLNASHVKEVIFSVIDANLASQYNALIEDKE
ncbi:O-acetyl-ADP-ribose deacetylase [Hahella sp. CCB-MM4]|uniref:O-acetyl-ADP-ribose deacetylase n=1 Tax=Hahella sp. (strain CCB-MM4) TaxID=1926491 RepID=UPI000B9A5EF9|nr:O-acetyl-ADP-ribose deacetylase [Hahella sp. CCB-MM4]OZG73479.1 O-acetyl-ADP-ribose deacetylase [Hahella sp. CCB-MM4]